MYKEKIVTVNAVEEVFLNSFIDSILADTNRVTLKSKVLTDAIPSFVLRVWDCVDITFTRTKEKTTTTTNYTVTINLDNSTTYSTTLAFSNSSSAYATQATRRWCYNIVQNDTLFSLRILGGGPNAIDIRNKWSLDICVVKQNNNTFCGVKYPTNPNTPLDSPVDTFEDSTYSITGTLYNRLAYQSENSNIEVIQSKSLLNGLIKVFEFNDLWDCSTVSPRGIYVIRGQRFYALNENTLCKI